MPEGLLDSILHVLRSTERGAQQSSPTSALTLGLLLKLLEGLVLAKPGTRAALRKQPQPALSSFAEEH